MARRDSTFLGSLLLLSLLSFLSPSTGLRGYGPYSLVPADTSITPSACKVRDISLYGSGDVSVQPTADACITNCKTLGASHYTFSTLMSTCGCGNSSAGFTSARVNTGVVSGAVARCKRFPQCSNPITVQRAAQMCMCPGNTECVTKGGLTFRCCCMATYPVVFRTKLVSCSPLGA